MVVGADVHSTQFTCEPSGLRKVDSHVSKWLDNRCNGSVTDTRELLQLPRMRARTAAKPGVQAAHRCCEWRSKHEYRYVDTSGHSLRRHCSLRKLTATFLTGWPHDPFVI